MKASVTVGCDYLQILNKLIYQDSLSYKKNGVKCVSEKRNHIKYEKTKRH